MKWHWLAIVLVAAVMMVGCAPSKNERRDLPRGIQMTTRPNVYRVVDEEAGVVCWVYSHRRVSEGGIWCLPLSATDLDY